MSGYIKTVQKSVFSESIKFGIPIKVTWPKPVYPEPEYGIVKSNNGESLSYTVIDRHGETAIMRIEAYKVVSGAVKIEIGKFE